jgi:hypothetical protein
MQNGFRGISLAVAAATVLTVAGCYGDDGGGSGGTHLTISSPAANATVQMSATRTLPIEFTLSGFTLQMAGTCGSNTDCGHLHLRIDGDSCNNVQMGKPYNAVAYVSPITANLALCPSASGTHTFLLELHDDHHAPVMDSYGTPITAQVRATVQ